MTKDEALKLALEALENHEGNYKLYGDGVVRHAKAIAKCEEALAQPAQQEPVAYLCENAVGHKYFRWKKPSSTYKPIALHTTPPNREWVDLTEQEALDCFSPNPVTHRKNIEAKLKEKNT